jgi:glycosyltransferase involved in cell wall biosynthesis
VKPARVAFIASHALPGGAERYLELLMGAIGSEWIAGAIVLQDGVLVERLRAAGHPVRVVETGRRLGIFPAALRLRAALRELRPDVVHANGVKAALVAALALAGTRIPIVWVKHDFAWDGPLVRLTALASRRVVAVSSAVAEVFGARSRRRVRVVPNGLPEVQADAAAGRRCFEELLDLSPGAPVVLLLGRVHPVKGTVDFVAAAAALHATRPEARFAIVGAEDPGEPAYPGEVRRAIADHGLEGVVKMLGHRDSALDLVAAADVVAVPSGPPGTPLQGEGFGLVALEAMAVGTPVVAYAAGAVGDVLGDCGVLVEPGDTRAFARALLEVLDDDALRARLADCGRARVRENFSLDRVVEAMRRTYAEAAN